ncbi:MAG: glycerol-3-phosphate 1-O-acyltransferase PlsY [Gemmatimonadota bacterium]|nr:glycerol-3-phosphate 1-O-acyltransferase PlsY [Gemmatimonadota bacterium]
MIAFLLLVAAYLIGAFPTSYLMGQWQGVDLRSQGSGNLGATNVYRVLGFLPAVTVLGVDLLKGFIPVWFFTQWDGRGGTWALGYGIAAIAGHVWPIYTKFRGGKGVATAAGTLLAVAPVAVTIAVFVWVGTLLLTRTASIASLISATLIPILANGAAAPRPVVLYALFLGLLVWWTHRANLLRLIRRQELQIHFGHRPERRGSEPDEEEAS